MITILVILAIICATVYLYDRATPMWKTIILVLAFLLLILVLLGHFGVMNFNLR